MLINNLLIKNFIVALLIFLSPFAYADAEIENIRNNLSAILPENIAIDSIKPSAMEGTYIVTVGAQIMFVRSVGGFIMVGDVYDTERQVSIVDEYKDSLLAEALKDIPESEMILMGEPKPRYVTVFTDTDCHFCQLFHKTVPELQKNGMQVRYMMFPRSGIDTESYYEAVSVWCSDNQAEAITVAKSGGSVPEKQCENPVAAQLELGRSIGIRGTPTLILDNGKVIPGYMSVEELLAEAGMAAQ